MLPCYCCNAPTTTQIYTHVHTLPVHDALPILLMQGKDTPRPEHAHAFVDAWSSRQSGTWLENNYAYGHANTLARPKSKDLLRALQLTNPNALKEPNAQIGRAHV